MVCGLCIISEVKEGDIDHSGFKRSTTNTASESQQLIVGAGQAVSPK